MKKEANVFSVEEKQVLLHAFGQSGQNASEFCRHQGISVHTFRKWQQPKSTKRKTGSSEFVAIPLNKPLTKKAPLILCYGRYEIKVPAQYEANQLHQLLDVLEGRNVH